MVLGKTFPDKPFQAAFARQLDRVFRKTPWMISVDAADDVVLAVRRAEGPADSSRSASSTIRSCASSTRG